ncbi:hypothetical protein PVL29_009273 [Vitis rotundifolia]|uniref:RNA polymerase Rpb7-like N-terminal domain-containing protein n=1 Tax=Vitis rotundifolia TaxID=103349 RepID=A0AA38ZZY4_VITRO|nr:hypothetical protein PVL29_009273 [Vitis rotundifolia]
MFFLSLLEHTLQLRRHLLDLPLNEAVKGEFESLFLDKVIVNLGLCISVYDMRSIDCGFVFPRDVASILNLKFGKKLILILFFPFLIIARVQYFLVLNLYMYSFVPTLPSPLGHCFAE